MIQVSQYFNEKLTIISDHFMSCSFLQAQTEYDLYEQ